MADLNPLLEEDEVARAAREEAHACAALLRKASPVPNIAYPILRAIWDRRLFPMVPVELFVLDRSVESIRTLDDLRVAIVYRNDPDYPDCWTHPGGYLGGSERIADAAKRVAKRELGVEVVDPYVVSPTNFPRHPRDHEMSVMVVASLATGFTAKDVERRDGVHFCPFTDLPTNLLPQHQELQARLVRWLSLLIEMPQYLRADFLNFAKPFDSER